MQVTTSISDHVMIHGVRCRQIRPVSIPRQMPRWLATIAGCAAQKKAKHPSQRTRSWTEQKPVGQSFRIMGPTWSPDTGAFYRMDYVFRRSCQTLSFYDSILKQTKVIGVVYTSIESLPGSSSLVWTPKHHQKQTVWGWHFTPTEGVGTTFVVHFVVSFVSSNIPMGCSSLVAGTVWSIQCLFGAPPRRPWRPNVRDVYQQCVKQHWTMVVEGVFVIIFFLPLQIREET